MKKIYRLLLFLVAGTAILHHSSFAQNPGDSLNANFAMPGSACIEQPVLVSYIGNAPPAATFIWNFDSAVIISGSGPGPYQVKWITAGIKTVTLTVHWNGSTATQSKQIHIMPPPLIFHMTGGGSFPAGGPGVPVGLSGSELNILYKLFRNGVYTNQFLNGTGQPLNFGNKTDPGTYTCKAIRPNSDCFREMEGTAVVIVINPPPPPGMHPICMVTFDTISHHNKIIWNKFPGEILSHFNIFRETDQNEVYAKIAEVPFPHLSIFIDTTANPLVRSDKYRITAVDTMGHESEKSPFHKTIHLNIGAGIYGFNLIWNYYEGFEFKTYHIYRKFGSGPFVKIASVASNINSFTDMYVQPGVVAYYIGVVRLEPCNPSLKDDGMLEAVSNVAEAAPLGYSEKTAGGLVVYPNPAVNVLNLVVSNSLQENLEVSVISPDGRVVMRGSFSGTKQTMDVSSLSAGIYYVTLKGSTITSVAKFIRQ